MSTGTEERVQQLVNETAQAVQTAMKAGLELQQASARWMVGAWGDTPLLHAWQQQQQALWQSAIQAGRTGVDSLLQAVHANTRVGLQMWQSLCTPSGNGHGNGHESKAPTG